jgi:predicted NAD/FAD-binding protein
MRLPVRRTPEATGWSAAAAGQTIRYFGLCPRKHAWRSGDAVAGQPDNDGRSTRGILSVQQFEQELRRAARFVAQVAVADPLQALLQKIIEHPAYTESRLLTRLLAAITSQHGEFRLAEAAVFDARTLALAVGLLDMRRTGSVSDAQLRLAVDAASAAQLAVDT